MKNPEKPTCQPAREIETDAGPMALTVIEGGALRSEEIEVAESLPEGMVDIYDELFKYKFPEPKNKYDFVPDSRSKHFYFEMHNQEPSAVPFYVKATKHASKGFNDSYTFTVFQGPLSHCLGSTSSTGITPLIERDPLSTYNTGVIGQVLTADQFEQRVNVYRFTGLTIDKIRSLIETNK